MACFMRSADHGEFGGLVARALYLVYSPDLKKCAGRRCDDWLLWRGAGQSAQRGRHTGGAAELSCAEVVLYVATLPSVCVLLPSVLPMLQPACCLRALRAQTTF